jgi:NAD(P)H-dependent FMN reductase
VPAKWIYDLARQRAELDVELVDLKDFALPLFNEMASNRWMPSADAKAVAWQKKAGEFDGYIVVTPEYNRSITGALKNAFDQCYNEWGRKPIGFVGYGVVGAARAVEHARTIATELNMVNVRTAAHIGGGEFYKVHPGMGKQPFDTIAEAINPSATTMLDEIIWWGNATKAARAA